LLQCNEHKRFVKQLHDVQLGILNFLYYRLLTKGYILSARHKNHGVLLNLVNV